MRRTALVVAALFITALVASAPAAAISDDAVPAPLRPWIPWVLDGHAAERCPARIGGGERDCWWYGRLEVAATNAGATFRLVAHSFADAMITLPGNDKAWPQDVTLDGKPAAVVALNGLPALATSTGEHVVQGRFLWDALPESLAVPADTAVVTLTLSGKPVTFVDREVAVLWLKRTSEAGEREEDRLDVAVFRKVTDGVPLMVETRVLLEVAGKGREVVLPGAVLEGFAPLSLEGSLPARVDGAALKVQVRPGRHTLTLVQRRDKDERTLAAPAVAMGGEGSEEIWVYQADTAVRVATVEGVVAIVAEQTRLPAEWRGLPAYRVQPSETFTLDQKRRGDESPAPSQLSLQRTLWLDFDGKGMTLQDNVWGHFDGDRLTMGQGTTLGRVSTGDAGGDAFITQVGGGRIGVEVRNPELRVRAESRLEGAVSSIPAVSWDHDFIQVSATLHLPPGYELLHAGGVDEVHTTWLKSWTLFEIFLVVVLTLAFWRLWGPLAGLIALFGCLVTFQEADAPRWSWVVVAVLAALARILPASLDAKWPAVTLRWLRLSAAVIIALIALVFAVQQVRAGMYPVLAQQWRTVGDGDVSGIVQYAEGGEGGFTLSEPKMAPPPPPMSPGAGNAMDEIHGEVNLPVQQQLEVSKSNIALQMDGKDDDSEYGYGKVGSSFSRGTKGGQKKKLAQVDPNAVVQTGPGLPQWGFSTVQLQFSGPVKKDQQISLVLIGPRTSFALALVRVALVALLVLIAFGLPGRAWPSGLARAFRGKGALFTAALLALLAVGGPARAEENEPAPPAPPSSVLDELRARLLAPPPCGTQCAQIPRLALEATDTALRVRAEVHALAPTAVPLPGADPQWTAASITVDGRAAAAALADGGSLWIAVPPGRHDVVLEGPLPRRDAVQLALPLVPRRATFSSTSWALDGLGDNGVPDANLQLSRTAKGAATEGTGEQEVLPPFLLVERSLALGLSFEVETRVSRLSPVGVPVVVEIPLLPGESVTTDGVRVDAGKAQLSLGPNESELSFSGALPPSEQLALKAPTGVPWVERWSLDVSPVWHVEEKGIPPQHEDDPNRRDGARTWRPWPGEELSLAIARPQGVPGQTLTFERTSQRVRPGLRSTDVSLTVTMRASRGGQHAITLPAGAELLSATVNGARQPLRADKGKVLVPVLPGAQTLVLEARVPDGITTMAKTPLFDLGAASVNAEITVELPHDRWVLFASGPRAGPAVLFWSFLVVIVLAAAALARVPGSPLKAHHWVLLSLGLTQVPIVVAALVAGWLLALGWRQRKPELSPVWFNLRQLLLAGWTAVALIGLLASIHEGLLGAPDMQIEGNGSSSTMLRWFADRAAGPLPVASVVSVPMMAYRVAMLAWSLWLALSLLSWLKRGFAAFSTGGLWREVPRPPPRPAPASSVAAKAVDLPGAPTSAAVPSTGPTPPKG
ncbi:MAG: hypothetical protein HYS27_17730 [Deltaproteobacteria bacterium]|nr:hypothetical protein [Deltaproteobacteria bacterium]